MVHSKRKTAPALLLSLVAGTCGVTGAEPATDKQPRADPRAAAPALENLWTDLASTDDGKACRALLALAARPKESTAFLKDRLRPVKADPVLLKKLIAQLDDGEFIVREAASKKLADEAEHLGKFARPLLEEALKGKDLSPEVKRRLGEILTQVPAEMKEGARPPVPPGLPKPGGRSVSISSGPGGTRIMIDGQVIDLTALAQPAAPPRPNTQWLRAVRAVALLESMATPEAQRVLETLAGGEPEAPPTQGAKAALERLAKSKQP
jgi:hypothetical protein